MELAQGRTQPSEARWKDGAIVRLDPDVAERFPTSESVNTALRALARESLSPED